MNASEALELTAPGCEACGAAYPSDAAFCDNCGVAAPALAPASSAPPVSDTLAKVRNLVRDKTRFEPEDLQPVAEDDAEYPYRLAVRYELEARCEERKINGFFKVRLSDVRCDYFGHAAFQEKQQGGKLLRAAMAKLEQQLREPETGYNAIDPGVYLGAQLRRYHLKTCNGCAGKGKNQCNTCYGQGQESCWGCYGALYVPCDHFGCFLGKVDCMYCSGRGHTSRQESYQESVQVGTTTYDSQSGYRTDYHTEWQTRYREVHDPCFSCSGGKVNCSTCSGTSRIQCRTCHATGKVRCRTCVGTGSVTCPPCDGSGQIGDAAWTDVHAVPAYSVERPGDMPDDARSIADKEGPHQLAVQAAGVGLLTLVQDKECRELLAQYAVPVRLVRLTVDCNQVGYGLVAYGRELRWLTLDEIVEDLLRRDLQALSNALAKMADDGLFASDIDKLLDPLHHVAASELNAEVVEAVLDDKAGSAHAEVISAEYASTIESAVLGALRHIYTRFAKRSWWHGVLAAGVLALGGWLCSNLVVGLLLGALALPASVLLFRRRLRAVLGAALGGDDKAQRAMGLASKGKRDHAAYVLTLAPALLVLLVAGWALPMRGPLSAAPAASASQAKTAAAISPDHRQAVDAVMRHYTAGDLARAREGLEPLAQAGNAAAWGPYGWMVLLGEGLRRWQDTGDSGMRQRVAAASGWADKAIAVDDTWGYATKGMMQINARGGRFDMAQGMRNLELAGNRGHLGAMHFLGTIYYKGVNLPVDHAMARKWFGKAAEQNDPSAMYNLGLMDWAGAGIARADRPGAMRQWRRAAALGNESARKAVAKGRPVD